MSADELIQLAWYIVNTCAPSSHDKEDMVQDVALDLWLAQKKYDPAKNSSLKHYLWMKGRYSVKDYRRRNHRYFKQYQDGTTINTIPTEYEDGLSYASVEDAHNEFDFRGLLAAESPRNREILLDTLVVGLGPRDVGVKYNIHETRVCQIVERFRGRCLHSDSLKSSPVQRTACRPKKPHNVSPSAWKRSRPIVGSSLLDLVQRTSPTPSP